MLFPLILNRNTGTQDLDHSSYGNFSYRVAVQKKMLRYIKKKQKNSTNIISVQLTVTLTQSSFIIDIFLIL